MRATPADEPNAYRDDVGCALRTNANAPTTTVRSMATLWKLPSPGLSATLSRKRARELVDGHRKVLPSPVHGRGRAVGPGRGESTFKESPNPITRQPAFPITKHKHRRASQAINARKAPPILEFCELALLTARHSSEGWNPVRSYVQELGRGWVRSHGNHCIGFRFIRRFPWDAKPLIHPSLGRRGS